MGGREVRAGGGIVLRGRSGITSSSPCGGPSPLSPHPLPLSQRERGVVLRGVLALALLAGLAGTLGTSPAAADNFRIENRVYFGNQEQPETHSTTLFYAGIIYDFLDEPAEVAMFDKAGERFILLDLHRRITTEISTADVAAFVARIHERASRHPEPSVQFLAEPTFAERLDTAGGELTLTSEWLIYRVRLSAASPAVARQYREFSDWYAKLSTVLNPSVRPPAARLRLNEALERQQATPREVELTITPKKAGKGTTVHSKHDLTASLTAADLTRIAEARGALRTFQPVSFEQYRKRD
jgi:hypothetical protein